MSKYDSSKTEHENMMNKAADIREIIWQSFPDHWGEMIGCPYSVLCYAEDHIKDLEKKLEEARIKKIMTTPEK